jgi:hypothetical protein
MRGSETRKGQIGQVLIRFLSLLVLLYLFVSVVSCGSESTKEPAPRPSSPASAAPKSEAPAEAPGKTEAAPGAVGGANVPAGGGNGARAPDPDGVTAANIKSIEFTPGRPTAGEPIKVQVTFDESVQAEVPLYCRWKVNEETVPESESHTLAYQTKRGDRIEVMVFVGDAREEIRARRAEVVVDNAPPLVKKVGDHLASDGTYVARLEATDPDGDVVTLKVQQGPPGMVLDSASKELRWAVPEGTTGTFPVEIMASDPAGASVVFSYVVTIRQVQPSAGSAANATSTSSPPR